MTTGCTTTSNFIRAYDTNTFSYSIYDANYNKPNFRYIVKMYRKVSGSYQYASTLKLTPNDTGYAYYNPTHYISNFLTSDIDISANTLKTCSNSTTDFQLKFWYEYGNPVVEYTGTTANSRIYYNGCQTYEGYDYLYGTDYWSIKNARTDGHFLTPITNFYLDSTEKLWLYFISQVSGLVTLTYTFYDSNGTYISEISEGLNLSANTMLNFGAGPANLISGSTPTNWGSYKITLTDISNDYIADADYTVYRKDKCDRYDSTSLYWLNFHGGWSNFLFNKKRTATTKINRTNYDKFLSYGYSTNTAFNAARGLTNFRNTQEQEITLNTDWVNDEEVTLLEDLFMSTDVRVLTTLPNGVQKLIPCIVLDTEFVEKNVQNDKLFNYSIKIKMATQKITQNG